MANQTQHLFKYLCIDNKPESPSPNRSCCDPLIVRLDVSLAIALGPDSRPTTGWRLPCPAVVIATGARASLITGLWG